MKKSLIAGAGVAAFAFAALPFAGVFAADTTTQTDKLNITVDPTCTMSSVTHANGDSVGTWGSDATKDTLSATVTAGEANTIGTTTFTIKCNNKTGWNVAASANPLAGKTTTTENIPVGTVAANTAAWSYVSSASDTDVTAGVINDTPVAQSAKTTGNDGHQFTMTYSVSTDQAISAQTYEGTITYTLAANS